MTEYLLINCLISIWALMTHYFLLKDASHRFTLLMLALLSWLVPFGWFVFSTEVTVVTQTQPLLDKVKQPVQALISQAEISIPWFQLFISLMAFGLAVFLTDYWRFQKQHKSFKQKEQATKQTNTNTKKKQKNENKKN